MFKVNKQISKNIIASTNRIHVGEINISGANYFVKPDDELKEIIGYYLARLFNLNCAKYSRVKIGNKSYAVSLDLNNNHNFILAHEYAFDGKTLDEITEVLRSLSFFDEILEKDMIRMYLYDILFMNDDRHDRNWGFLINEKARIVLLDNGAILRVGGKPYICFDHDVYLNGSINQAIEEDFLLFYESLERNDQQMVDGYLKKACPRNILNLFQIIEAQYQCQINPLFLQLYEDHYERIVNVLNEKRCNYGR